MTTAQITWMAAVAAMIILVEFQIVGLKKDLRREIIIRKSNTRVITKHIRGLWQDIRDAGIPRSRMEECDDDRSGSN